MCARLKCGSKWETSASDVKYVDESKRFFIHTIISLKVFVESKNNTGIEVKYMKYMTLTQRIVEILVYFF